MEGTWSHPPLLWARYRDDVYVPWTHGQEMLEEFHLWLNSRMPGIKFTLKASLEGTEFLDTFIYMKAGQLHTKPYSIVQSVMHKRCKKSALLETNFS